MRGAATMEKDPIEAEHDDGFVVVRRFMWKDLGLSGVTLMVYARICGFCESGAEFYDGRSSTAGLLGTTSRSVTRSINDLLELGFIEMTGYRKSSSGKVTRSYRAVDRPYPSHDETSPLSIRHPPDETSPRRVLNPDGTSGEPVTGCQPKRKGMRKRDG